MNISTTSGNSYQPQEKYKICENSLYEYNPPIYCVNKNANPTYSNIFSIPINQNEPYAILTLDQILDHPNFSTTLIDDINGNKNEEIYNQAASYIHNNYCDSKIKLSSRPKSQYSIDEQNITNYIKDDFFTFETDLKNYNYLLLQSENPQKVKKMPEIMFQTQPQPQPQPFPQEQEQEQEQTIVMMPMLENIDHTYYPMCVYSTTEISDNEMSHDRPKKSSKKNQKIVSKSKNTEGKEKDMDEDAIEKRNRHNLMEKHRRRFVAYAFNVLLQQLNYQGNKKMSKANILTQAKQFIFFLTKRTNDSYQDLVMLKSRRDSLISRLINLCST